MSDKGKVESVLFASSNKVALEEIAKLTGLDQKQALNALRELQKDYDEYAGAIQVVEEGAFWKFMVRTDYFPIVQNIVSETELSKTVMETLAVVAWKAPVLQSEVIRIRTNKAYDHIKELEEAGFVTAKKQGRSKLLRLTDKFFSYFDLRSREDIKEKFGDIKEPAALQVQTDESTEVVDEEIEPKLEGEEISQLPEAPDEE